MDTVTVSSKYQVVIPRSVRTKLAILPGARLQVIGFNGYIELIPLQPIKNMRGFLKGLDSKFIRDDGDRN